MHCLQGVHFVFQHHTVTNTSLAMGEHFLRLQQVSQLSSCVQVQLTGQAFWQVSLHHGFQYALFLQYISEQMFGEPPLAKYVQSIRKMSDVISLLGSTIQSANSISRRTGHKATERVGTHTIWADNNLACSPGFPLLTVIGVASPPKESVLCTNSRIAFCPCRKSEPSNMGFFMGVIQIHSMDTLPHLDGEWSSKESSWLTTQTSLHQGNLTLD
jgi:hypothetical protein